MGRRPRRRRFGRIEGGDVNPGDTRGLTGKSTAIARMVQDDREEKALWAKTLPDELQTALERVEGLTSTEVVQVLRANLYFGLTTPAISFEEQNDILQSAIEMAKNKEQPYILVQIARLLDERRRWEHQQLLELSRQAEPAKPGAQHIHFHGGADGSLKDQLERLDQLLGDAARLRGAERAGPLDSDGALPPEEEGLADSDEIQPDGGLPVQHDSEASLPGDPGQLEGGEAGEAADPEVPPGRGFDADPEPYLRACLPKSERECGGYLP